MVDKISDIKIDIDELANYKWISLDELSEEELIKLDMMYDELNDLLKIDFLPFLPP